MRCIFLSRSSTALLPPLRPEKPTIASQCLRQKRLWMCCTLPFCPGRRFYHRFGQDRIRSRHTHRQERKHNHSVAQDCDCNLECAAQTRCQQTLPRQHLKKKKRRGPRPPRKQCSKRVLGSLGRAAPSASESSAPGYSRPIHALLLGCAAQSSAVPGCSAPPKRESPQVTTEPALRICSRGLRSDDSWKLHISQLSLADAAISAAVRSAPGHNRSIAKQCGICPPRCLDVLHIPQLLLDSSAISATASIAQVSPDPSPSSAANARSDAWMCCTFPSCPSTSLLSAPARRVPQVTQTHLQERQPMRLPKLGCAAHSQQIRPS